VHRASTPLLSWLALASVVLALGCSPTSRTESARLIVSLPPDAPAVEVTRVLVTLTGPGLATRTTELSRSEAGWTGLLADIPEGPSRSFSAEAFDASGTKRFVGRADNIQVTSGRELVVTFTLESTGGAAIDATLNRRPVLASLTASPSRVDVGQTTTVMASASDADGDAIGYQWSVTGCSGQLDDATSGTARFTPSARPSGDACGSCRLELLVTDARGGMARGSIGLCVGPSAPVNLAPQIVDTDISDTSVGAGQHVDLGVRAWDPQGGALTFSWELVIGQLRLPPQSTATTSSATWIVPSCIPFDANPPLRVVVRNAQGQSAVATFPIYYDGVPTCNTNWVASGSMSTPRNGHTATLLSSGLVLVAGGSDGVAPLATAELYDPASGTWTSTGSMNTPRFGHSATLLDSGQVLVVGGYSATHYESLLSAELYDPATGTWSYTASMDTPRYWHSATKLSWGAVLISGGLNGYDQLKNVELYMPSTGGWIYQGDLSSIRYQHTSTLLPDNRVLVTGGKGTGTNTAEVFDQITGQWTSGGTMGRNRSSHAATLLPNGKVLITGGNMGYGPTDYAELYDPAANTWSTGRYMDDPRMGHTATLLPNGKVLVVGGNNGGQNLATCELYDTATGLWGPASNLVTAKQGHGTVVLNTGKVLAVGGSTASGPSAASELYSP